MVKTIQFGDMQSTNKKNFLFENSELMHYFFYSFEIICNSPDLRMNE